MRRAQQPPRAAAYCRLSYAPDGSVEKVERQEADARRLADQRGWDIVDVYTDNNESAWQRNRRRPGWHNLLDGINAHAYDVVIVYHLDRLMRQPHDLEELLRLADQQNLTLASPHGTRNLDNPDDRFVLRIEVAQACREVDNISRRSRRGWQARAEQGAPRANGLRAYGWQPDRTTLDPHEADVLRAAVDHMLTGGSLTGLVNQLNAAGERTSTGRTWHLATLRKVLTNPRLAGKRTYHGQVIADGQWQPLLDADTFARLQTALDGRTALHPGATAHRTRRYLLSGIARCAETGCGGPLYVQPRGNGRRGGPSYTCRACRRVSRTMSHVDAYVVEQLLTYLEAQQVRTTPTVRPATADADELERLTARIEATLAAFGDDDTLTPDELRATLLPLKHRQAEVERRVNAARARDSLLEPGGPGVRERWAGYDLHRRRRVIVETVEVTVGRSSTRGGSRFDYSTITVTPL